VPHDDAELVARYLATRDEESFRLLFRRHSPGLHRLAVRLLGGNPSAAEDALQETWVRAATGLSAFRFESALRTWLCGIVVNCCREARRRTRREEPLEADEIAAPASSPLPALDLERVVVSLAEGYREVLVLHDVMGYTHREIADRLGIEEGTSKSQLFLARRALRRRLEGHKEPSWTKTS
jgi:RNA polymerase sigma-70 factor, ECF subfamily